MAQEDSGGRLWQAVAGCGRQACMLWSAVAQQAECHWGCAAALWEALTYRCGFCCRAVPTLLRITCVCVCVYI